MTEQDSKELHIKCSRCKMKYLNNDEHIRKDFGYNRLNERYKTCVTCRDKRHAYLKTEAGEASIQLYRNNHRDDINKYNFTKITCATCGALVCRNAMRNHEKLRGCSRNDVKPVGST